MDRRSRRCNKASRENCKKKWKERHKGATEDKEESQDNNKNYTMDACEKRILKDRLKLLKELITDKIKAEVIKWIAESISNNTDNGSKIW